MPASTFTVLRGDDLSADTLSQYLQDATFVEYFNSFLLLPAFTSQVFYNARTDHFEQVFDSGFEYPLQTVMDGPAPSDVLYLTDDVMGQTLDKLQGWLWVAEHRLPLFLKSDLLFEYKLCKFLTSSMAAKTTPLARGSLPSLPHSAQAIPRRHSLTSLLQNASHEHSTIPSSPPHHSTIPSSPPHHSTIPSSPPHHSTIPSSPPHHSTIPSSPPYHSTIPSSPPHHSTIPTSHSSSTLVGAKTFRDSSRTHHRWSVSVQPAAAGLPPLASDQLCMDDFHVFDSKVGMSVFRRFLEGKAGEKSWLFWLDAERVKHATKSTERQRVLRELEERYLRSGGSLTLPSNIRSGFSVSKTSKLTIQQVDQLQLALAQSIKEYWCPRFLLHHRRGHVPLTTHPLPTATPMSREVNPPTTHPLTPTHTPTFKRLSSSHHLRSQSSPGTYSRRDMTSSGRASSCSREAHVKPSNDTPCCHGNDEIPAVGVSRKVWMKVSEERPHPSDDTAHEVTITPTLPSAAYHSRIAKYIHRYVPTPTSRCTSASADMPALPMCESRCHVISISGTPEIPPSSPMQLGTSHHDQYTSLLQCLATEHKKAGNYFHQYLENLDDKLYLHCLMFWREVQHYKCLFTKTSFSPCDVEVKAKLLFGRHIAPGSMEHIGCPDDIIAMISGNLWPAYEDLFDEAEEHVLTMLLSQWNDLCWRDSSRFHKLEAFDMPADQKPSGPVPVPCVTALVGLEEEPMAVSLDDHPGNLEGDMCDDEVIGVQGSLEDVDLPLPPGTPHHAKATPQRAAISLSDILKNDEELEQFKMFLNECQGAQDLMCWMEIEAFRAIASGNKHLRHYTAKQLRQKYFTKEYFFGPNSPTTREAQREVVAAGGTRKLPTRPKTPVFIAAQKHVRAKLEKKWVVAFITSPQYLSRHKSAEIVGDHAHQDSQLPNGIRHVQSFASSREAILLRNTLRDAEACQCFQRFLILRSSKEMHPVQNIAFWLEVQRFKEMCHAHTTELLLQEKMSAITDCFISSSSPPKLQVDIPIAMADDLCEKPVGPYMFREAQATIFKLLHNQWIEYKNFQNGLSLSDTQHALDKMQEQLERLKPRTTDRSLGTQERNKLSTPRFETMEEKKARLEREEERAELQGDIAVSFRLSTPNPKYIYYTEVPEGCNYCPGEERLRTPDPPGGLGEDTEQQAAAKHISFSNTLKVCRSSSRGPPTREASGFNEGYVTKA
eukprot:Em0023g97a